MKSAFFIICSAVTQLLLGQVTFVIDQLPEHHDYEKEIFISGDFEGWTGGQDAYKLEREEKQYLITLPVTEGVIQYKFTQGSWGSVEYNGDGTNAENRVYTFSKKHDTVFVKIASWEKVKIGTKQSTAAPNVSVISDVFKIPQLNRERKIWVYLPPGYISSTERYPVLYMHDGQNIFDKTTSYAGEWEVDETLNKLFTESNFKLIVVGIDNGEAKRMNEYSPWENSKYGKAEGTAYLEFITKTLKPYIDSSYRTLTDKSNTGIMGSSMGGLISHYAGLTYPDIFGKAGVFSPSFWYSDQSFDYVPNPGDIEPVKMYYLMGGKEGERMVPDMNKMIETLHSNGYDKDNIQKKIVEDGIHNESFWKEEFEEAVLWLFPNALQPVRTFKKARLQANNELKLEVSDGVYKIKFFNRQIVQTSFIPSGQKFSKKSHAVVLKSTDDKITFDEKEDDLWFSSGGISVNIKKSPFKISYFYKGQEVISEKNGYRKIDSLETIQFNLDPDEVLYGGGARALGMNRRGNRLELYNKAHYGYETRSELMNYTMPLVMSSKKYALHFDNAPIGFLDLDSKGDNTLTYETISGRKTYQLVVDDSWTGLIDSYTDLTGKQPMPPRWVLGNFASRFGYHSEKQTRNTLELFRKEQIPVDAVIIDIYWFGKDIKGHMGNLEFLRDSFPDPQGMIRDFKNKGIKTVLVSEPFILSTSKRWKEAVNQDILAKDSMGNPYQYEFYFGNTGLIDVYNPKAGKWFWNIYKDLANMGVEGIWGDLGEPEVHPPDLLHETGTADELHNTYGHDWARLVYEGYKKDFPDKRPFILMRSGSSGSQRFGLIPWSGDVNRSWGGLQSQPEIALQMGIQGLGYMHSDLGGFAGANLDDELYTRWLQYGVFQPVYRPHAQEEVPSEPVYRSEKVKKLTKEAIELRYSLLPYNYQLVYENNQNGTPLMRPLFFEEPDNKQVQQMATTYLWGDDFLIAPILTAGVIEKEIYFPGTSNWFDFYTGEKIQGSQTVKVKTEENRIPTYVRGGAFIPVAYPMQSTEDYDADKFKLHFYYDPSLPESEREFYNDDGKTTDAIVKGLFEMLEFEAELEKNWLEIEMEAELGENTDGKIKQIELIIHNIKQPPLRIRDGRRRLKINWDKNTNSLTIPLQWNTSEEKKIRIKL